MRLMMTFALLPLLSVPASAQGATSTTGAKVVTPNETRPFAAGAVPWAPTLPQASARILGAALSERSRLSIRTGLARQEPTGGGAKPRTWIKRHPALFGALVGASAGAVASGTMENELFCSGGDEDCFFHGQRRLLVGAGLGAGVGALIGWISSR